MTLCRSRSDAQMALGSLHAHGVLAETNETWRQSHARMCLLRLSTPEKTDQHELVIISVYTVVHVMREEQILETSYYHSMRICLGMEFGT
jgi:hypothetical protein